MTFFNHIAEMSTGMRLDDVETDVADRSCIRVVKQTGVREVAFIGAASFQYTLKSFAGPLFIRIFGKAQRAFGDACGTDDSMEISEVVHVRWPKQETAGAQFQIRVIVLHPTQSSERASGPS